MTLDWSDGRTTAANTHWNVQFNSGTVERGSSGSPLFNSNKRVIGQFHGGLFVCASVPEYYGKLSLSWTGGGSNATRLSNWLDPLGTGAVTSNTSVCSPPVIASFTGPTTTPNGQYASYHANLSSGSGATNYQWILSPQSNNNLYGANTAYLDIAFYTAGNYQLVCKAYNGCGWGEYYVTNITVTRSGSYSAATNNFNVVTVTYTPLPSSNQSLSPSQSLLSKSVMVDYKLVSATSGTTVASGRMPSTGGTLDFSGIAAGIYVLHIDDGSGTPETFKIVLH